MATREELKQVFANGQMATGEKFANLIDSMKVVQLPVVDPQALGTSLSFIDSISQDADGKITATKKTLDLANAHELNPFKGWYKTGDTLPTDGFDGAYLYFKDTTEQTGLTTIYRWNGTAYADTGTVVDTSNVNTFATGQALNEMAIDGTGLDNPTSNALAKAVDVAVIKESLSEETEVGFTGPLQLRIDGNTLVTATDTYQYQRCWYIPVSQGDMVKAVVTLSASKNVRWGFCEEVPANGVSMLMNKTDTNDRIVVEETAPVNGYFVLSHTTMDVTSTHKFYIIAMNLPDRIKKNLSDTGLFFAQDEDITSVVSGLPLRDMIIGGNSGNWASGSGRTHVLLDATGIMSIVITPNSESHCSFAFLASYETPVNGERPDYVGGTALISATEETEFRVPFGTKWICFNVASDMANFMPSNVVVTGRGYADQPNVDGGVVKTIYPVLRYGTIRFSNGEYDDNPTYANRNMVVTPRYIKTANNFKITSSIAIRMRVLCYDKNLEYLGSGATYNVVANTALDVHVLDATEYVKILFTKNENYDVLDIPPMVSLEGNFDDNWDVFNVRPSDSGYHRVQVVVNVTNPTCCDSVTNAVQDEATYLCDYGVICLPETYSNTGRATRLIIYCHGSAVDYTSGGNVRFDTVDLQPEYWLKEGYAVMDMDGDPFTDAPNSQISVAHGNIPQSIDCYVAGYKWAIEHYNLRRDGVFIGGRSLGSRTALLLSREQVPIPVIACCPNAGPNMTGATWNYSNSTRRAFMANHRGFVNQPTWTSDSPMSQTEWDCLKENYDKLVKNSEWSIIVDLPDANALFASALNISKNVSTSQAEWDFYSVLHARVGCPVKIFGCNQDETSPMTRGPELTYKMLVNGGVICELRKFNSTMDYSGTGTTAHHYDTQDPSLRAAVTTRYGEQLTNVPIVYIEMLQFWRRFEQEN